jgi:hypothetical protein
MGIGGMLSILYDIPFAAATRERDCTVHPVEE